MKPWIKTSLAPGSGVVKKYFDKRCLFLLQTKSSLVFFLSLVNFFSTFSFAAVCRSILTSLASILLAMVVQPALEILEILMNP